MPRLTLRCLLTFTNFHLLCVRKATPLQELLREVVGLLTQAGFTPKVMDTSMQACPGSLLISPFLLIFVDDTFGVDITAGVFSEVVDQYPRIDVTSRDASCTALTCPCP